jgi:chromosome partitioning protein
LEARLDGPMPASAAPRAAHVIVLGNEKGGSGKSTTAMHLIVALLKAGRSVASIDTDSRQGSLTRYVDNRRRWARKAGVSLDMPEHFSVPLGDGVLVRDIEQREYDALARAIDTIASTVDFVIVDTPAANSYLMKLSHSIADTLVTPLNDSFIDFDVLGRLDPDTLDVVETSHYATLVNEARNYRHTVDGVRPNWVVVRNRLATLASRNQRDVVHGLRNLSAVLDFRLADGISERVIFRELFLLGLTVFDSLDRKTLGRAPSMSHLAARREVRELIEALGLPGTASRPAGAAGSPESLPIAEAPLVVAD